MAIYRMIHISFWQDRWVETLTSEQKYFYLYLLTNSATKQCGCYEIGKGLMRHETGLTEKAIDKHLKHFIDARKIDYNPDTGEILIRKWLEYNSFKSSKVRICIDNELRNIKYEPFKEYILAYMEGEDTDSVSIDYEWTIDSGDKGKKKPKKTFTDEFEKFWSKYPRQISKKDAFAQWCARLEQGHREQDMIDAAVNYALDCKSNRTEQRYIKHPATFIGNKEHFLDYIKGLSYKKTSSDTKRFPDQLPDESDVDYIKRKREERMK